MLIKNNYGYDFLIFLNQCEYILWENLYQIVNPIFSEFEILFEYEL